MSNEQIITINDREYKTGNHIYKSGIDDVFTSYSIYEGLKKGDSKLSFGSVLFIIDNRDASNPKMITTKICSVKYGPGAIIIRNLIDGKMLASANSVGFGKVEIFHEWLNVILKSHD